MQIKKLFIGGQYSSKDLRGEFLRASRLGFIVKGTLIEISSGYYLRCPLLFFIVIFSANTRLSLKHIFPSLLAFLVSVICIFQKTLWSNHFQRYKTSDGFDSSVTQVSRLYWWMWVACCMAAFQNLIQFTTVRSMCKLNNIQLKGVKQIACDKSIVMSPKIVLGARPT